MPPLKTIDARSTTLDALLNEVEHGHVALRILRDGRPVAEVRPIADQPEQVHSLAMLDRSAADIEAGRVRPAKEAIDEIAQKFGLMLERRPASRTDDGR